MSHAASVAIVLLLVSCRHPAECTFPVPDGYQDQLSAHGVERKLLATTPPGEWQRLTDGDLSVAVPRSWNLARPSAAPQWVARSGRFVAVEFVRPQERRSVDEFRLLAHEHPARLNGREIYLWSTSGDADGPPQTFAGIRAGHGYVRFVAAGASADQPDDWFLALASACANAPE